MKTTLKFDPVILTKEMNEKFKKVGDMFEVANVLDDSFLLRDGKTKVALGVVSFKDFEKYFVHEQNFKGWTPWTRMIGFDGQNDVYYRTNRKKIQVKFLTSKVRAEACCCKDDEFNLSFGLHMAYLRCLDKALINKKVGHLKKIAEYETGIAEINRELAENGRIMQKMINSLEH
jgi:hypothetical protein